MSKLEASIRTQLELHHRISRIVDNLKKLGKEKITPITINTRLEALESHWNSFQSSHNTITAHSTEEFKSHDYFVQDYYAACETVYFATKDELLTLRQRLTASTDANASNSLDTSASTSSRNSTARALPKISLPKFSGDYHSWPPFRDLFKSMIVDNSDVPPVEKLHYLKNHVTGEAARRISNLAVTSDNFMRAWDVLVARYENKRVLVSSYLDQLFGIQPLTRKSADELKDLVATVKEALGGLKSLGAPTETWDYFIVYFVAKRLDSESREAWELQQGSTTEPATFSDLEDFLDGRTRALEMVAPRLADKQSRSKFGTKAKHAARANVATNPTSKCSFCNDGHYITQCPGFSAKSVVERREVVNAKHLCFNCLGSHKLSECRTTKRCRLCDGHHHTLIHLAGSAHAQDNASSSTTNVGTTTVSQPIISRSQPVNSLHVTAHHTVGRSQTLLATALVQIVSEQGQMISARVLLDQGSELSFVRESLAQLLRLPRSQANIPILGIGSRSAGSTRGALSLRLRSCVEPAFEFDVLAYVLTNLTGCIPSAPLNAESWTHINGLSLADPSFATPSKIDLVLGADVYGYLLRPSISQGAIDQPTAQDTALGWILSGPTGHPLPDDFRNSVSHQVFAGIPDYDLNDLLSRFWTQEEIPSTKSIRLSAEEEQCEQHFITTHTRDPSGRYVVRLPFRSPMPALGSSYSAALRMLLKLQRRLASDRAFSRLYSDFLLEYETLEHMSRTSDALSDSNNAYFLPHHGVLRESSSTTKLRVVFNGSCRTTNGVSLNECLHIGPKQQLDIFDILLKWRRYPFVFSADIEKMYRQISIHPDDRRYQQILWSTSGPPTEYQLNTVTYGLACAPYLALRVLRQLALDEGSHYPEAADIILNEMYVDDVLSGADSISRARAKAAQLDQLLMAGGFKLQKWTSNEPMILDDIQTHRRAVASPREFHSDAFARALGLAWNSHSDVFVLKPRFASSPDVVTKRIVISRVAQIFDPLGWITPITITSKVFLQELWKLKMEWDDPLPDAYRLRWKEFEESLGTVAISIPRWLGCSSPAVELHGFSDASQDAMGAVIYVRVLNKDSTPRISLVAARSKVAPIKRVTIPRLELSAAVLLGRLVAHVQSALNFHTVPVHLWVDSTVALTWIIGQPCRWKEFVANRVALLQELVPAARWHHVAGRDNPADCASRGLSPTDLADHPLWWTGPPWLSQPSTSWPETIPPLNSAHDLEERPARTVIATTQHVDLWDLASRYSDFSRLTRITAWLIRAISRFQSRSDAISSLVLTPSEILDAEIFWLKQTQTAYFAAELATLTHGSILTRSHPLLRLVPFVDNQGLLRVGGRLRNSLLDSNAKHPILLPRESALTQLILNDIHSRTLHGGVQLMLSVLRQRFWILGGRAPVSSFVRRCVRCARYRAVAAQELMGQLPSSRVTPSRPFLHSGVDYAGPFLLRTWRGRSGRTYKGFLIVFVCFSTSAVHLELATDYSSQGFIAAFRRFSGRRGICASLTSDCGTNLIGADAELRRMFDAASHVHSEIANALASTKTEWRFNPPAAPHFGGKWEAAVKSVKFHLRRLIGDSILTYEELSTLLVQVEAILNSRPLCPLSDDPADLEPLTPAHFLIGCSLSMLPEPSLEEVPTTRLSRWQFLQRITQQFWRRWTREYLQRLQDISKWRRPSRQVNVGSLVLLIDERYPPSKWPLGRVTQTHSGSDGLIRVVTVRTANSTFKRPIVKLCPLPVSN